MFDPLAVKEQVRTHYGGAVRVNTASGCCAPSYGCGDPFAAAALRKGEFVLDLGSGSGFDALIAARSVGAEGRVYGLDMTDEMLEIAQRNARLAHAHNVVFLKGDIESIPLPNESVDVIISNCVVNLTPDKRAAFTEAYRVLRPNGRLAISDVVIDGDLTGLAMDETQIREALSWVGCVAGAMSTTRLRQMLVEAGFSGVSIDVIDRYSGERLTKKLPGGSARLPDAVLQALSGRFTSSLISGVKA